MPLFLDIDMKMRGHPVKKDTVFVTDAQAVSNSIKMLVLTNYYERPFNSELGGNITALLFELADEDTSGSAESRVTELLQKYEPRCEIVSVQAENCDHTLVVSINFRIINSTQVNTTSISLKLTR